METDEERSLRWINGRAVGATREESSATTAEVGTTSGIHETEGRGMSSVIAKGKKATSDYDDEFEHLGTERKSLNQSTRSTESLSVFSLHVSILQE